MFPSNDSIVQTSDRVSEMTNNQHFATTNLDVENNIAPTTHARRKSASDSVQNNEPKIVVPSPQSARKPKRLSKSPLQQRQGIKRSAQYNMTTFTSNDTIKEEEEEEEEEEYSIVPLVVSRDDENNDNDNGPKYPQQPSESNIESIDGNDSTINTQLDNSITPDDPNCIDNQLLQTMNAPTMEEMHSKMHQLFVLPTLNQSQTVDNIDWNDLIFHRKYENKDDQYEQILPLLSALVRVEAISLESYIDTPDIKVKPTKKRKKTPVKEIPSHITGPKLLRKVHFLSFDGSSIRPPVDRDLQSGIHQQQSIEAMIHAKEVMDGLTTSAIPVLRDLQNFLHLLQSPSNSGIHDILHLCASSISNDYPSKWVPATINLILNDLTILKERFTSERGKPLQLELRLAEHLGRAIRYQLRVLFNRAPPRLSSLDTSFEHRKLSYSKVNDLITMNKRDKHDLYGFGLAVSDGFLSALISRALRRLYEFIDMEHLISGSEDAYLKFLSLIPTNFCASEPSHRHLSPRIRSTDITNALSESDRDLVIADVQKAAGFLSATYAARFLCDIFTTPGVNEEVIRMGGWSSIERYASISIKYQLYESCPADAHLVPLCDHLALLKRLQTFCDHMEPNATSCIEALEKVAKNYRIPKPSSLQQPKRKLHQYVADIVNIYNDMMTEVNAFPEIGPIPIDS